MIRAVPRFLYGCGTRIPCPPNGGASLRMALFLIYLRLRTVTIRVTSKLLDMLDVLDVVGGGGVSALPSVGMFPGKDRC